MLHSLRKRDQIWVAYSEESSKNHRSWRNLQANPTLNALFNWTVFPSKRATFQKKIFHIHKKSQDQIFSQPEHKTFQTNKSKDFCWMVSNCGMVWNNRFKLANPLMELLSSKVHIWGHAYKRGCIKKQPNIVNHGPVSGLYISYYDEAQKYMRDCKFYFAFENTNCSDYVTEKFVNSIAVGAIPIVNGWPETYRELLPGSYIHVNQFSNVSQLAQYLDSLLRDEKEMNKYQEWRKLYTYERAGVEIACELCKKLEQLKIDKWRGKPVKPSIVDNMASHFKSMANCGP